MKTALLLICICFAPLEAADRILFVEPFDFHYPEEGTYPEIGTAVRIIVSRGEYEPGTFIFLPETDRRDVRLYAADLRGPSGSILPRSFLKLGVVTYLNRERIREYLDDVWIGGLRAGAGKNGDSRGFNQDAKDRLPMLPAAIVPDEAEFEARQDQAVGHITLTALDQARAQVKAGRGKQFWITVNIPPEFDPPHFRTLYRGNLKLVADGIEQAVPLEVEVLDLELDGLAGHGRYFSVSRTFGDNEPEFKEAILDDLLAHGLTHVREPLAVPEDYDWLRSRGIVQAVNTRWQLTAEQFEQIRSRGFDPYVYGADEPGNNHTYEEQILITNQVHERGGLCGTAGAFDALAAIDAVAPQDFWTIGLCVDKWYSPWHWNVLRPMRDHLDQLRQNPAAKIAGLEDHYVTVLSSHYPLGARILAGFWLYCSKLDGIACWGYCVRGRTTNPYTDTAAFATAFPAQFNNPDGSLHHREMLPSYTWEAYREGGDDLRYALTADRVIREKGTAEQRSTFEALLEDFILLDKNGDRYDYRNPNGKVRQTRWSIIDLLAEILAPGDTGQGPLSKSSPRRR